MKQKYVGTAPSGGEPAAAEHCPLEAVNSSLISNSQKERNAKQKEQIVTYLYSQIATLMSISNERVKPSIHTKKTD